ncbi:hypothetical protein ANT2_1867 [plant metagenome]|uniref:Uncharacterized protein n=1 Tax=plant metagenome TaxID=1297885 RepID=A0A484RBH9_9ZZZZ
MATDTLEFLFLGMVAMVVAAMLGGALAGRARTVGASLRACAVLAVVSAGGAYGLAHASGPQGAASYAPLLACAALLFTLVIAFCASLMARRLHARR